MAEHSAKIAAVQGTLKERPLPRLLQQLLRKEFTGYFVIADQMKDESEVYLREGSPVHVRRPVDTDRLDRLLVEYGVVSAETVAAACAQLSGGLRLGEILEKMGAIGERELAQVLKTQMVRKLTRLFFIAEGTYAVYQVPHAYGEGGDLPLMRVDPRSVVYPGIRATYDLPRVTQELARLLGQRFRLREASPGFIAAMGIQAEDITVDALRRGWMTINDLDAISFRPIETRSVALALYYADMLERQPISGSGRPVSDAGIPRAMHQAQSSDVGVAFKLPGDSGPQYTSASGPVTASAPPVGASPSPRVVAPSITGSRPTPVLPTAVSRPTPVPPTSAHRPGTFASIPAPSARSATPVSVPVVPVVRAPLPTAAPAAPKPQSAAVVQAAGVSRSGPVVTPEAMRANILSTAEKLGKVTHFELLGVGQTATADQISTAFVRAARQYHPDRLVGTGLQDLQPVAEKILARINEAAMILGNTARRAEYVESLSAGPKNERTNLPTLLEAENLFLKGEVFLKKGDHIQAIDHLTKACQENPSEPQYRAYLAWARFDDPKARKDMLAADTIKTMEAVLRDRPKFARAKFWLGLLWKFQNHPDKAMHAFRDAADLDPSLIEASREARLIEMRKNKQSDGQSGSSSGGGFMGKFFKR